MARIDLKTSQIGSFGTGDLQLQNGDAMDATLRLVTDAVNTASPLKLSTSLVQSTSTVKITTSDVAYIDAEDNSGNNRFTVSRAVASQLVTVDFASLPSSLTTPVGAIRTATDGVNLANVATFLENGNIGMGTDTPTAKLDIAGNLTASGASSAFTGGALEIQGSANAVKTLYLNRYGVASGSQHIIRSANAYLLIETANSEPIVLSGGNVGIGTSTPKNILNVRKQSTNLGTTSELGLLIDNTGGAGTYSQIGFGYSETTCAAVISGVITNGGSGTNSALVFATRTSTIGSDAPTERMRITSDGYVRLTTNSGGVQFNGDTATANALNDYEEGTWTMGVSFGGVSTGVTFQYNAGTYTKIGRQVTVNGYCVLTSQGSSTGSARITGLPFTVANTLGNYGSSSFWFANINFVNQFQGYGNTNDTTIDLRQITSLGAESSLTHSNFANNSAFMVGFTYFV